MIKFILADDENIMATSLAYLIKNEAKDFEILDVVHTAEDALHVCRTKCPDVAILDVWFTKAGRHKPEMLRGYDVARIIKSEKSDIKILILTGAYDNPPEDAANYIDSFLRKDCDVKDIVEAVRLCMKNKKVYDASFPLQSGNGESPAAKLRRVPENLNEKELQILRFLSEGKSYHEIADIMGYSEGYLRNVISKIRQEYGVEKTAELISDLIKVGYL